MKKLIILLSLITTTLLGQDYGNQIEAMRLCASFAGGSNFSSTAANSGLNDILNSIGAAKRFVLQPCNVNNASAITIKGIRYIFYDPDFMNSVSSHSNWGNTFILAHEVGHHINGHTMDAVLLVNDIVDSGSLYDKRIQELEADEFAGFVIAKLGGPLSACTNVITRISDNTNDELSSHPSRDKRLAAVNRGYNKAENQGLISIEKSKNAISEEYFYAGLEASDAENYQLAIEKYTISLSVEPSSSAYNNRALNYLEIGNYQLALTDVNNAIEKKPEDDQFYSNKARILMNMATEPTDPEMVQAIEMLSIAINKNPSKGYNYLERGMCKWRSLGWNLACPDFKSASILGEILPDFVLEQMDELPCD